MNRINEPSTWAGAAAMLQLASFFFPQYSAVIVGLQTTLGAVAVVLREGVPSQTERGGP